MRGVIPLLAALCTGSLEKYIVVQYWADQISLMAGYVFFFVPIIQWSLWRIDKRWVAIPIAMLMFSHGLPFVVWGYSLRAGQSMPLERWQVAYFATEGTPYALRSALISTSMVAFLIWMVISRFPWKNFRGQKCQPLPVGRVYLVLVIVIYVANIPLAHYKSLQFAVETDDLDLATRRLEFNWAGLGPNDGRIIYAGTYGVIRAPLLPVAVEIKSKRMVELLLAHGAELNSEVSKDSSAFENQAVVRNPLTPAIENEDFDMLDFLINKGADPTDGIDPAVFSDKPEVLQYLLGRGADLDVARNGLGAVRKEKLDKMLEVIALSPE